MMRAAVLLIIAIVAVCAFIVSEADEAPLQVQAHGSGAWAFNAADYPLCVTVKPPPLRAQRRDVFHPQANVELS